MIIGIDEQEDKTFDISAAPYNSEKYDLVDRGYVIPDIPEVMLPPKKADQVHCSTKCITYAKTSKFKRFQTK